MLPLRFSGRPCLEYVFLFPGKHATVITALSLSHSLLGLSFFLSFSVSPHPDLPRGLQWGTPGTQGRGVARATAGRGRTQAPGLMGLPLSAGSTGLGEQNV